MRTTLRIAAPLILSLALASFAFGVHQVQTERRTLREDLSLRVDTLTAGLQKTLEFAGAPKGSLNRLLEQSSERDHIKSLEVYDLTGEVIDAASSQPANITTLPAANATRASQLDMGVGEFLLANDDPVYVYAVPLHRNTEVVGALAVVYDAGEIESRIASSRRDLLFHAVVQILVTVPLALFLVRWTFTDPLAHLATWLRRLHAGQPQHHVALPRIGVFEELSHEVAHLARDLGTARASAQLEAQLRESHASMWTAERLRVSINNRLGNQPLFVVANREPYMHAHGNKSTEIIVPASGLVTAIEPILVACHGTWIAHGAGNADRTVVDEHDRLRVPPDRPSYTLRRVWLEPEEERGYYYGFSNEGLWPLCHIAHTRPTFRPEDWRHYQEVNQRFADAVVDEMAGHKSPILLAHDYHFALLPRLVKRARPDARVALFWHIPWPNPEAFGICPWQRELVDGLLGADLIGFHTQSHCNNFLGTVDRAVEALTNWDRFSVNRRGHVTSVRPYPISVAFPAEAPPAEPMQPDAERTMAFQRLGVDVELLAVGVDRVDYTKGIPERFRAIERLMDIHPQYRGRFTLVQIGAPSRTDIGEYQRLMDEVVAQAERINRRFQTDRWKPIVLLMRHHSHQEIARYYRVADVCLVTSLHDGMNLVAKEFVAAREDNRGVLVLSTFTGAALELTDALLVNPYDVDQMAEAIHRALVMPINEQTDRMRRMRRIVGEHNVFRWAERLLSDLVEIRLDAQSHVEVA